MGIAGLPTDVAGMRLQQTLRLAGEKQRLQEELDALRAGGHDLDETRRLLYMALVAGRTSKHSLAGTLINALVHHNLKLDRDDTIDKVVAAIEGDSAEWLLEQIDALTERLDS